MSKSFDASLCAIPTVYCGKNKQSPKKVTGENYYYVRKGTSYECMKKGFGAGMGEERRKNLPSNSLQNIKYIGPVYAQNFASKGIKTIANLIKFAQTKGIKKLLHQVLKKSNGILDTKAYNSTLLFLYKSGSIKNLPRCKKITTL